MKMSCESIFANKEITQAQAQAFYACQYFEAVKKNADINLAIAGIQQAAAFYFADKQHDTAKQSQNRLDDIWKFQKEQGERYFNHWDKNARPEELEQLQRAIEREREGYQPDYETAKNRVLIDVRSEFGKAREKLNREQNFHCVGANQHAHRQLNIAEAKTAVASLNQAYRAEEQRKDLKEAQYREELYKWLAMFRGSIGDSLNAANSASKVAAARSTINQYDGWIQAISGLSHLGRAYNTRTSSIADLDNSALYGTHAFGRQPEAIPNLNSIPSNTFVPMGNNAGLTPSFSYTYSPASTGTPYPIDGIYNINYK